MRLNPHFLFNTLQNISVLAEHEPKTASQMLARLGDLLRASFRSDFQAEVTLETELGLTQAYLDVESIRFGDRLSVSFDIAPGTEKALVPALLLQPLVENAIIHGLRGTSSGKIGIRSGVQRDQLVLAVSDNGTGPPAECLNELNAGIGLSSTSKRLARMYPGTHGFKLRNGDACGTEVLVTIPFRVQEAQVTNTSNEQSTLANCR
jgi:LytS/YehU family sensor histidine kinase